MRGQAAGPVKELSIRQAGGAHKGYDDSALQSMRNTEAGDDPGGERISRRTQVFAGSADSRGLRWSSEI